MDRTKKAESPRMGHWIGGLVVALGGLAVLTTDVIVGAPLAGWQGAAAASVFAIGITTLLAAAFTHGHQATS
ncbi:MAG TPA: hypothetical protein VHB97_02170 [Polyangia bacterium]|jgi:hypothetical protein|nr:hypothetical protein [Polyangia bacterium]